MRIIPWGTMKTLLIFLVYFDICSCVVNQWAKCASDKISDDCPQGWVSRKANCYLFVGNSNVTYDAARAYCADLSSRLAKMEDEDAYRFIKTNVMNNAIDSKIFWYTAGRMNPQKIGDFYWDGYPDNEALFDNNLGKYILETLPRQENIDTWDTARQHLAMGTKLGKFGFYLIKGDTECSFVCQGSKVNLRDQGKAIRDPSFGARDLNAVERGPCINQQPIDEMYVPTLSPFEYIKFSCEAYAFPQVQYRWYRVPSIGNSRTLINPEDDKSGLISQTGGTLVLHKPSTSRDSELLQCEAYNSFGSVLSNKVNVIFGSIDDFSKQPRESTTVQAYTGVVLECSPPNHSPSESLLYSFYMVREGDKQEPVTSRLRKNIFVSLNTGKLCFSEVTTQDDGIYVCMITMMSTNGKTFKDTRKSPDIPLTVREGNAPDQRPIIQDGFPSVRPAYPYRNDRVRIECFSYGLIRDSLLEYTWSWDGGELPETAVVEDYGRVVIIPSITEAEAGTYTCTARDYKGIASTPKSESVRVRAKPYFVVDPGSQYVDHGSTATFKCEARGTPVPTVIWYYNDMTLADALKNNKFEDPSRFVSTSNELRITDVREKDNGMYGCQATSSLGMKISYGELRVFSFAPNFNKYPRLPLIAMVGHSITLPCKVEGAPEPTITWYFNNGKLSPSKITYDINGIIQCSAQYCIFSNNNLYIPKPTLSQKGMFKCEAKNALGTASSEATLDVVQSIGFTMKPITRVVQVNTTVDIPCQAVTSRYVDINYSWKYEGIKLLFDRLDIDARRYETYQYERPYGRYFGNLRIVNIQFQNDGQYTCEAQTSATTLKAVAIIRVAGPPGPCAGVVAELIPTTTRVKLRWMLGAAHHGTVRYFTIYAKSSIDNVWRVYIAQLSDNDPALEKSKSDPSFLRDDLRNYEISNLAAFASYTVRISATNEYGTGEPSPTSEWFTTEPAKPSKAPQNVTGGGGKTGTLVIRWNPLDKVDHNGPKFGYTVYYRQKKPNENDDYEKQNILKPNADGEQYMYTVMLGRDKDYLPFEVKVCSFNELGEGKCSPVTEIMSSLAFPTATPFNIQAGGFNSTALTVSWEAPVLAREQGIISGYRISYWPRSAECQTDKGFSDRFHTTQRLTLFGGEKREGVIIGLRPDQYYCITVAIFTSAGDGPDGSFTEMTTFKNALSNYPTKVTVNSTENYGEVKISWVGVQAQPQEESLDSYWIRYWIAGSSVKESIIDIDCALNTYGYIQKLSHNTRYNVRVYGRSRGGVGQLSSPMIQFTLIPRENCQEGYYDGQDIRYVFICGSTNLQASLILIIVGLIVNRMI